MADKPGDHAQLMPPWRDRNPDGTLSDEYGPSPGTFAKRMADHKNWAFRPRSKTSRLDAEKVHVFMAHSKDVPAREVDAYRLVYQQGHSVRWAASKLGIRRDSVKRLLQQLRWRANRVASSPND